MFAEGFIYTNAHEFAMNLFINSFRLRIERKIYDKIHGSFMVDLCLPKALFTRMPTN